MITADISTKPEVSTNHVGLLGIPDADSTNYFTTASGSILDISVYEPLAFVYETLFMELGYARACPTIHSLSIYRSTVHGWGYWCWS